MKNNQNQTKNKRILAIDPGTKEMGIAVLDDRDLIDYAVKSIRRGKNQKDFFTNLETLMLRLIHEKKPDVVALERNLFSQIRNNLLLAALIYRIKTIARRKRITVREYDPRTIRKLVCNNGNATKKELARAIAVFYPELKIYLESDRKWKIRYWQNIFDAVAVGLAFLKKEAR